MRQISEQWSSFYREADPGIRKKLLDDITDCGGNPFPKLFFESRYPGLEKGSPADMYLRCFLELMHIPKNRFVFAGLPIRRTDSSRLAQMLGADLLTDDEQASGAFYQELCNAVRRYLGTTSDPAYGMRIMGMLVSRDRERQHQQAVLDLEKMRKGAAELAVSTSDPAHKQAFVLLQEAVPDVLDSFA